MGHSQWLDSAHEFREKDMLFDGSTDMRLAPMPPVALNIIMETKSLVGHYLGKKCQLLTTKEKEVRQTSVFGRR